MAESEYGKYIVTKLKENIQLPNFRPGEYLPQPTPGIRRRMNHVIWMDSDVAPGAFYSECVWFFPEKDISPEEQNKVPKGGGPEAHTHPFEEVITFFGTNFDDPHDLGGEIELWLEDEQFVMDKSFLAYIPAGMRHCPLKIRRIERPMFHFTLGPGQSYQGDWNPGKKHGNEGSLTKQFVFQTRR
jgi:hypothetical protein